MRRWPRRRKQERKESLYAWISQEYPPEGMIHYHEMDVREQEIKDLPHQLQSGGGVSG